MGRARRRYWLAGMGMLMATMGAVLVPADLSFHWSGIMAGVGCAVVAYAVALYK